MSHLEREIQVACGSSLSDSPDTAYDLTQKEAYSRKKL
jgi:hypothetical protein